MVLAPALSTVPLTPAVWDWEGGESQCVHTTAWDGDEWRCV